MGAYWDQVAQRPSLLQIFQAAGITKAQRDARAQDEAAQQRQLEQQTYERGRQDRMDKLSLDQMNRQQQRQDKNDQAKLDAAKQTTDANKSRYAAQIVASDPSKAKTMAEWLRGQGIESEQANVSLPGGEQIQARATGDIAPSMNAEQFATDLEGRATGVLGMMKPGEGQKTSVLADKLRQEGYSPNTPEWAARAKQLNDPRAKAGADPTADLRKEFQNLPVYKDTQIIATAYEKIKSASPTGAGDLGLIFGYMKMLDPGSSVREGEFANAENSEGVSDKVRTMYNRALNGERISPALRAEFKSEAGKIFGAQRNRYESSAKEYRRLAEANNAAPGDVVLNAGFGQGEPGGGQREPAPRIVDAQSADRRAVELEQAGKQPQEVIQILRAEGLVQ